MVFCSTCVRVRAQCRPGLVSRLPVFTDDESEKAAASEAAPAGPGADATKPGEEQGKQTTKSKGREQPVVSDQRIMLTVEDVLSQFDKDDDGYVSYVEFRFTAAH
ncbi:hypothetical protein PoB_002558900 [Plakobranchus ocellatus]|uniref:EF-hand domain-containing protein n=1 Tax=Plakobranchus ocellatus TaxID=259542 RepID=A0AAV3ZYR0_9GAST|nr:hypothetical protein PoB_002558900 [Plakobranchus ocellatus]